MKAEAAHGLALHAPLAVLGARALDVPIAPLWRSRWLHTRTISFGTLVHEPIPQMRDVVCVLLGCSVCSTWIVGTFIAKSAMSDPSAAPKTPSQEQEQQAPAARAA